ncbi:hypothetical protein CK936_24340 [Streptomyces albireticuli]|uniref:Uncharacterized protein n=1 Tax=Streptomyces albireticuli TaxID=1940 RepID=A0A2A2D4T7_9ACTN|nr:hypothetical protein CK936_24340 [Streptomyces albireticuli]
MALSYTAGMTAPYTVAVATYFRPGKRRLRLDPCTSQTSAPSSLRTATCRLTVATDTSRRRAVPIRSYRTIPRW